ncbi:hypothetical protein GCM10009799_43610 [Nocardiopsis rhodophaea]|uniref:Uncharacterized protein n=1 Tax=Nocardiopsis rhodophaea TaxID=280238 RepID=A0ABP5EX08_9ACTN
MAARLVRAGRMRPAAAAPMFRGVRAGFAAGVPGPVLTLPDPVAAPRPVFGVAPFSDAFAVGAVGTALVRPGEDRPPDPLAAEAARFAAFGPDAAAAVPCPARADRADFAGSFADDADFGAAGFALRDVAAAFADFFPVGLPVGLPVDAGRASLPDDFAPLRPEAPEAGGPAFPGRDPFGCSGTLRMRCQPSPAA